MLRAAMSPQARPACRSIIAGWLPLGAVIVTAGLGFVAGRRSVSERDRVTWPETPISATTQGNQSGSQEVVPNSETARRPDTDLAEDAQMQATRAFTEKTELGRLAAWQATYERVDARNWRSIFTLTLKARTAGMISVEEQRRIWQRIGEVAGREALDAMKPKDLVRDWELNSGRYAMQGWAQRDPAAAWSYIESLPAGNFREGMVAGYAWGRGPADAEKAIAALQTLPEGRQAFLVRRALENQDGRHMTEFAQAWLETPGDGQSKDRQAVFTALWNTQRAVDWDDQKGGKLALWLENFAGKPYLPPSVVGDTALRLASGQSPEAAISWVERMAVRSPEAVHWAASQVMQRYARADLDAAGQWLNAHRDSPLYDHAALGFLASQRAKVDADAARDWVATIRDPAVRDTVEKMFKLPPARAAR